MCVLMCPPRTTWPVRVALLALHASAGHGAVASAGSGRTASEAAVSAGIAATAPRSALEGSNSRGGSSAAACAALVSATVPDVLHCRTAFYCSICFSSRRAPGASALLARRRSVSSLGWRPPRCCSFGPGNVSSEVIATATAPDTFTAAALLCWQPIVTAWRYH